jgi:transposase InsO family protein
VKFAFIAAEKATYPVRGLCQTLGVSRAGFYAWHTRPPATRSQADQRLGVEIQAIHAETRQRYGSPRVHAELRDRGHEIGRKRVARLMRQHGLCARRRRRFRVTTDSNHPWPVAPNVLARQFAVAAPDTAWVTDITYLWTREGWLYLAVILDLFSRAVVGWALSAQITTQHLTLQALTMALGRRRPPHGLLHHSDRGSQYASADYQRALTAHGIVGSMSRRGNCWDNAVAESFFATLKVELAHDADWATRAAARGDVFTYLEGFYNGARRHSALGYLSPMMFERQWAAKLGRPVATAPTPIARRSPQPASSVEALGSILRRGAAISVSPPTTLGMPMIGLPGILTAATLMSVATSVPGPITP